MTQPRETDIPTSGPTLAGLLSRPDDARGLVIFVHGSGSSRLSPRNQFVAEELNRSGFATLLFDLLTEEEDQVYDTRFDIGLLTDRLLEVAAWTRNQPELKDLPAGYFGASTGAAAALIAAAKAPELAAAVVSRGGRPDMANEYLSRVAAPTLLIVGGADFGVIELNQDAHAQLTCAKELAIVPRATHLFEEPGALEEVARLAADWFRKYLGG